MVDIAIISGIANLEQLAGLGTIEMALTHLVLQYPAYASYYRRQSEAGKWVILDNGAYEMEFVTGRGLAADQVLRAAEMIRATELICQDVLYDGRATVRATKDFVDFIQQNASHEYSLMAVPQGRNIPEWLDCYSALVHMRQINTIGLSKLSVPISWGLPCAEARIQCVQLLVESGAPKPLHLLGGDRSLPWELEQQRKYAEVRSNDSSFAFWYSVQGIPLDPVDKRAQREADGKPDLVLANLSGRTLQQAVEIAELLKTCAGVLNVSTQSNLTGGGD